jgi:hypothetical protein
MNLLDFSIISWKGGYYDYFPICLEDIVEKYFELLGQKYDEILNIHCISLQSFGVFLRVSLYTLYIVTGSRQNEFTGFVHYISKKWLLWLFSNLLRSNRWKLHWTSGTEVWWNTPLYSPLSFGLLFNVCTLFE